ncbi:CHAD domain-containing protein [Dyella dinghuensis]|uniref:CHAD domain-containing protein n=1 Tax=Dyella dinghuensis TaxID=1920169 RepID=A0A432LXH1_9GAMM|nr:CHAD domain-containing protein [Dyella dinghuensis]RUL66781.1 CHAD domain-containing protein [Dyella dinghuensis]
MTVARNESDLTIGLALRAAAVKECRSLQRSLALKKQRHENIHRARKSCRRLRSLLAFVAPPPTRQVAALDNALRQLLRGFSGLRDAHIAKRTAKSLASAHEARLTPALLDALRNHSTKLLRDALKADPDWRRKRSKVERLTTKLQSLPWQDVTPSQIKEVIGHSAKRVRKARKKAMDERTPDAFHRWRRRARKLRYELELASKARRAASMKNARSKRYAERAKKLLLVTDRLGWRQDFQVFLQTLDALADTCADAAALSHALKRKSSDLSSQTALSTLKGKALRAYVAQDSSHLGR